MKLLHLTLIALLSTFTYAVEAEHEGQTPKSMKDMLGLSTKTKDPHAGMRRGMSPVEEEKNQADHL